MNSLVLSKLPKPSRSETDPDPEVPAKARRRKFTAKYKLKILKEAEQCTKPGEIGALLRREGLYSSHLSKWRQQCESGSLAGLAPKKRGRKARPVDPQARRVAELERENARLHEKLEKAESIIEVQKNSPSCWRASKKRAADAGRDDTVEEGRGAAGVLGPGAAASDALSPPVWSWVRPARAPSASAGVGS